MKAFRSGTYPPFNMALRIFFLVLPLFFIWVENAAAQAQVIIAPHESRVNEGEPVSLDITVLDVPQDGLNMAYRLVQYGNPQFRPARHVESIHHDSVFIPQGNQGTVTVSLETKADNFRENDYEIGFSILSLTGTESGEVLDAVCSTASEPYYFRTISAGCTEYITVRNQGWELQAPEIPSSMIYASLSAPPLVAPGALVPITARLSAPAPAFGMTVHFAMYETGSNFLADSLAPHSPRFIRHEIFIPPGQISMTRIYQLRHTDGIAQNCITRPESAASGPARGCILVELAEPQGADGKPGPYGIYPTRAQVRPQEILVVDHAPEFPVAEPIPDNQTDRKAFTFLPVRTAESDTDVATADKAEAQFTRSPAQSVKAAETVKTVKTEETVETDSGIDSVTENRTEAQPGKHTRVVETPFVNPPGHDTEITAAAKDEVTKVAKDEMNAQAERINDVNQANSLAQLPDGNTGANESARQAASDMEFSKADSTRANRTIVVNPPEHETQMTEATKDEMNAQAERIDDELATGASVTETSITEASVTGTSAAGANDIKNSDLPEIFIDDLTIGEHDGPVFFTISLSKTPVHEVRVNITTSDGSARQGEDYTTMQARAVFVPNGPLSLKLPVLILDDTDIESVETFIAQLSEAEYAVIAKKIGTVAIIDDDDTGQAKLLPQLSDGNTEVGENAQHAASGTEVSGAEVSRVGVSRVGVSETEVSRADDAMSVNDFPSEIPASNDLAGKMVDHSPASPVMTADNPLISPAVTSTLQAGQPISQIPDVKNEPAETDTTDTINVTDTTGTTGTVNLTDTTGTVNLTDTTGTANLTNTINTTGVIAEKPDPGTQIGETPKLPETSIGETPKLPKISINDITISEHEGQAVFVISLSRASRNTVSMNISTADITATEMDDYIRVQTTLSFAPGEQTLEFTVPVNDDEMPEPGETFAVRLDTPAYAVIAKETGTGTIIDDDHPNEVDTVPEISINDVTMDENAGEAVFAISLSETVSDIVTVNAATRDGSAIHPDDYTGTSSAVTFMPGETVQQFRVPLVDNDIPEPDRTFAVVLDNASGATIVETGGTGRIIDDGDAIPGISISDAILSNDGNMALFSIFLSGPSGMTISVNAGTRDGTARQPDDYTGTLKEVTFAPGETVQQFNVPLMRNEIPWSAGTFTVELNGAVNAVIEGRTGQAFLAGDTGQAFLAGDTGQAFLAGDTGQAFLAGDDGHVAVEEQGGIADDNGHVAIEEQKGIANDDGHMAVEEQGSIADDIPQLSIDDVTISEHDQAAVFVISLSRVSASPVTVRIETEDGNAVYPEDYIRRIKYLEFQPGTLTQGFDIPLVDDNIPESDEMFTVHLSEPEGAVVMNETGTGTIIDNDDDSPDILSPDKSAPSNGDHADIDDRTNLEFGLKESAEPAESEKPATDVHSPDAPSGPSEKTERETSSGKIVRAIRVVNTDRPESSGSKQDTPIQTRNSVSRTNTIPSSGGRIHPGFLAGSAIAIHRFQHVLRDSPDTVPAGSKNSAPAGTRFSSGSVAGRFLLDRQRTVLSGMPGIVRFFRQRRRSPNGLWSEITGRRGRTPNGSNVHFAGNFGFHKIKSERFLYGVMLQLQSTSTGPQAHTGGISGRAWLAGPYFAARHRSLPIYLEGKLLFGESANTLEPGGNGMHYRQGKFNTSRILAQFRLETDIDLGILGGTLIPHADLRWIQDQAKPFTAIAENDSRHQAAGQIIRTGEFELGSGIEIPIATGRGEMLFNAAAGVILSRSKSSHAGESSTSRGRVSAGLQYRLDENTFYEFNTFLDGIALPEYQEYGISLTAEYRF